MKEVVSGLKTHEFRRYSIPESVRRVWFYVMAPVQELQYIATIGRERRPGQIDEADKGVGNLEFNDGKLDANYAYKILQLYELEDPFTFYELKEYEFLRAPPPTAKYQWVKEGMLKHIKWDEQKRIF